MLRRALFLALAALALSLATGCAPTLVPFTQDLRAKSGLTKDELKNLQYYVSRRVTLRRELESGGKEINGAHQLVLISGKRVEEVVIEEGTPGIAVDVGPDSLAVSFEPGSAMTFTAPRESTSFASPPPNPFPGDDGAPRVEPNPFPGSIGPGRYALALEPSRTIVYQGKRFDVVDEGEPLLLIDAKALERVDTTRKVVHGMKLR